MLLLLLSQCLLPPLTVPLPRLMPHSAPCFSSRECLVNQVSVSEHPGLRLLCPKADKEATPPPLRMHGLV